ncbi:hypothetical protein [Symbiobacterium thermophilum]|uniref:Haem-binding uptake Tiki superfamily ChaN domain-containing protein n=1 Tax=Symbiobacterium thermophilum (strain DSM 24528 / JCM 14929 / IAM 14863 / T) TaxID=292459 RepID=Q67RP8_SYMTH|nr:hypothetical protein [Symbiobacterium thermophilum]BAD39645.1 conserved hypothetical protein [Symbiobacterium thermophilum IAM 14863]
MRRVPGAEDLLNKAFPVVDEEAMAAVAQAIGDAQIVLLGEQNHGDGDAFAAKVRLVEYMHRHHGFDVLLCEACFFSLTRTWER